MLPREKPHRFFLNAKNRLHLIDGYRSKEASEEESWHLTFLLLIGMYATGEILFQRFPLMIDFSFIFFFYETNLMTNQAEERIDRCCIYYNLLQNFLHKIHF